MRLHLEGMGLVGSLVAHWLCQLGVPFTWNDIESETRQAWLASTGSVIPTGDPDDFGAYSDWWRWWTRRWSPIWGIHDHMTEALFLWSSKHPPHQGKRSGIREAGRFGKLAVGSHRSLHLNVQNFVRDSRLIFAQERVAYRAEGDRVLVTHGFTPGAARHYVWGWHARVRLTLLAAPPSPARLCFYLRDGYVGDYLYPVPGEPHWYYGGSSRVVQLEPKRLALHDKVGRWAERIKPWLDGIAQVEEVGGLSFPPAAIPEGWRPAPDQRLPVVYREPGERWYIRPQGSSGVRHWPIVRAALAKSDLLEGV